MVWFNQTFARDKSTEATTVMDYAHHEIHSGSHFFVKDFYELSNWEVLDFLFITDDSPAWENMVTAFWVESEATVEIYENAVVSAPGVMATIQNRNRNSSKTALGMMSSAPTITSIWTRMSGYHIGSGKSTWWEDRANSEIILKQNTTYLIRITNLVTTANHVDYLADWYEHADKNA